jgi:hypothetical protein
VAELQSASDALAERLFRIVTGGLSLELVAVSKSLELGIFWPRGTSLPDWTFEIRSTSGTVNAHVTLRFGHMALFP